MKPMQAKKETKAIIKNNNGDVDQNECEYTEIVSGTMLYCISLGNKN